MSIHLFHHLERFPEADKFPSSEDWVAALGSVFSSVKSEGITGVLAAVDADLTLKLEVLGTKLGKALSTGSAASCADVGVLIGAKVCAPIRLEVIAGATPIEIACT